jgi:hypothetical protein
MQLVDQSMDGALTLMHIILQLGNPIVDVLSSC